MKQRPARLAVAFCLTVFAALAVQSAAASFHPLEQASVLAMRGFMHLLGQATSPGEGPSSGGEATSGGNATSGGGDSTSSAQQYCCTYNAGGNAFACQELDQSAGGQCPSGSYTPAGSNQGLFPYSSAGDCQNHCPADMGVCCSNVTNQAMCVAVEPQSACSSDGYHWFLSSEHNCTDTAGQDVCARGALNCCRRTLNTSGAMTEAVCIHADTQSNCERSFQDYHNNTLQGRWGDPCDETVCEAWKPVYCCSGTSCTTSCAAGAQTFTNDPFCGGGTSNGCHQQCKITLTHVSGTERLENPSAACVDSCTAGDDGTTKVLCAALDSGTCTEGDNCKVEGGYCCSDWNANTCAEKWIVNGRSCPAPDGAPSDFNATPYADTDGGKTDCEKNCGTPKYYCCSGTSADAVCAVAASVTGSQNICPGDTTRGPFLTDDTCGGNVAGKCSTNCCLRNYDENGKYVEGSARCGYDPQCTTPENWPDGKKKVEGEAQDTCSATTCGAPPAEEPKFCCRSKGNGETQDQFQCEKEPPSECGVAKDGWNAGATKDVEACPATECGPPAKQYCCETWDQACTATADANGSCAATGGLPANQTDPGGPYTTAAECNPHCTGPQQYACDACDVDSCTVAAAPSGGIFATLRSLLSYRVADSCAVAATNVSNCDDCKVQCCKPNGYEEEMSIHDCKDKGYIAMPLAGQGACYPYMPTPSSDKSSESDASSDAVSDASAASASDSKANSASTAQSASDADSEANSASASDSASATTSASDASAVSDSSLSSSANHCCMTVTDRTTGGVAQRCTADSEDDCVNGEDGALSAKAHWLGDDTQCGYGNCLTKGGGTSSASSADASSDSSASDASSTCSSSSSSSSEEKYFVIAENFVIRGRCCKPGSDDAMLQCEKRVDQDVCERLGGGWHATIWREGMYEDLDEVKACFTECD